MPIADSLIPEFDHEMVTTRSLLAVLPEGQFDWKPHPKSTSLGGLAVHLATNPGWIAGIVHADSFDLAPGGVPEKEPVLKDREAVLATFDANVAQGRAGLAALTDDKLMVTWSLLFNGKVLFSMPRIASIRTWGFSHLIHHRGQLTVYLRLLDVKLPSVYGPTADAG